jgi:hypothetical protein
VPLISLVNQRKVAVTLIRKLPINKCLLSIKVSDTSNDDTGVSSKDLEKRIFLKGVA